MIKTYVIINCKMNLFIQSLISEKNAILLRQSACKIYRTFAKKKWKC